MRIAIAVSSELRRVFAQANCDFAQVIAATLVAMASAYPMPQVRIYSMIR